jgi:hypothetical protein
MKKIPLSQGQFALVDDEDFERVNAFKWYARCDPKDGLLYATRSVRKPKATTVSMARFIMQTPEGMVCDHVNHNTLDNRKRNLRNCTLSQNRMNQKHTHSHIGLKNITLIKNSSYRVRIKVNHKVVFEKQFKALDKAIEARDDALKKYHGEFANMK